MGSMGDLVAHLGVDNSQFKSGMSEAGGSLSSFVSTSKSSLTGFAGGIGSILAPIAVAIGGIWGAGESLGAYKEAIQAQRKLSSVIEATGGAAGLTTGEIADFAAEMQSLTNFEDDATTASAAVLAAFTNIRGQTFTDTIESAMDLTAVMGGDLQSNVKLLGKALNDPTEGLAKLARAGVAFTDEQKDQIEQLQQSGDLLGAQGVILDAVQAKFGGAAEKTADPMTQLSNTIGDVAENIGSLLLPSINVGADALRGMLEVVVGGGDTFKEMGIEAAVILENMGGIVLLTLSNWELFFVQIGADAQHLFLEEAPAYVEWFGENWVEIVTDGASNTLTLFENLGTNIKRIWQSILDYFSGTPVQMNWKPLTDGFISTVKDLPKIPPRAIGEFEKGLRADIEHQTQALAESMTTSRERLTKQFDTNSKVPFGSEVEDADATHKDKTKEKTTSKAALLGSSEAASTLLRGVGSEDAGKKTNVILEKTNTILENGFERLANMAGRSSTQQAPLNFSGGA